MTDTVDRAGPDTGFDLVNRMLALGGVLGPLIFVVAFTVGGLLRPGYSALHQPISDLGVGAQPWILNGSAVALGALLSACCVGFARALGPTLGQPWRWICPWLVALPGLGYAWAGVFTEAPATVILHWVVGMPLVAIGSIAGFLLTGRRLRRVESWRGIGTYSIVASVCAVVLLLTMFATWLLGIGGLMERAVFMEILAWYVVIGWRLWAVGPRIGQA